MAVRKGHATGYNLIELMAVLAIASALLVIAIPMFRTQVQNSRMSAAATDLLSTFMSAKSEAVGRNYPVQVCIRNEDADGCADNDNVQWEDGWLTFVDVDSNGAVSAGEDILQIHPPLADDITARGTEPVGNSITFQSNGRTDAGETEGIILCDARNYGNASRILLVSLLGKVSIRRADETGQVLEGEQAVKGDCLRGSDE